MSSIFHLTQTRTRTYFFQSYPPPEASLKDFYGKQHKQHTILNNNSHTKRTHNTTQEKKQKRKIDSLVGCVESFGATSLSYSQRSSEVPVATIVGGFRFSGRKAPFYCWKRQKRQPAQCWKAYTSLWKP